MKTIPSMVDMKRTPAEKTEAYEYDVPSPMNQPDYPYGLSISLCEEELDKLNIDYEDVAPGDLVHMHSMCMVTSVSKNDNQHSGPTCRIELQITHIAAEDESEEDEEAEEEMKSSGRTSKLYS